MADHGSLECMYMLGIANVSEHLSSPPPNHDTFGEWNCMYNIVMMRQ